jgi:hypothetical protein
MDEKVLFYIILGIIYFIFSRLKKKPNQPVDYEEPEVPQNGEGKARPVSFEDLLREITEAKQQRTPEPVLPKDEAPYKPAYVNYDDEIEDEVEVYEKRSFDQEKITQVYEEAKKQAFQRPSLEETLQLGEIETRIGRFKEFDKKERGASPYLVDLKDRRGIKKAIVYSEILNRKHF